MIDAYRVLDLSDERGLVCGWMLAELGADVVCVEPPGGSTARRRGPFAGDQRDPERSLFWWAYARNKRSICLDPDSAEDRATLLRLAETADVLVESDAPGELARRGLGYDELSRRNPGLVYVSITPFGQQGPKAGWAGTDLTVLAAGGPLWLYGDADRPPVRVSVPQAFAHAAAEGAAAALVALHERQHSGQGQHVDVSAQQAVTLATQSDAVAAAVGDPPASRFAGGARLGPLVLRLVYPARDGHVSITHVFGSAIGPATARLMQTVYADGFCDEEMRDKDWIGFTELLMSGAESIDSFELAKQCVAAWTATKSKAELLELAMERGLLIAPSATPRDVLESPQLAAREYFQPLERPDGAGQARQLGPFARFSGVPVRPARRAPRVGEHTSEVLEELASRSLPEAASRGDASESRELPLAGLKVLDFMWAIAGPMATRMLADYGATVVRVETTSRPDACRTMRPYIGGAAGSENAALFHSCNAGKQMITLDLANPASREVVLDLVRWADVVCESFTPGTMKKLGFDYPSLLEVNPSVIMLSTCLMGQTGPLATYAGYGNLAAAVAGFFEMAGWPDRDPAGPFGAYTDYIAPKFNASAVLAALEHRRRTGEGRHIDLSQAEAALHFLAPALLDLCVNGRVTTRNGNRDDLFAPHGVYPTAGDDAWIAIAVERDAGWRALCECLGQPGLADDARFAGAPSRVEHAHALDEIVATFTAERVGAELEAELQARGVAAHRVLDSPGLVADPQLRARGHFVELESDGVHTTVEATRSQLSRTPASVAGGPPTLGRDNHTVLEELLGYDGERIVELVIAGVLD
jgi:crotonobetainyl-CoA:carnitine CoA-transferase CaiB-like acyl-CoA transferase